MRIRDFLRTGHTPTLFCAFLYFDISFMIWVILGPLANAIVPDFGLNNAERGLMLALPLLGGALLRIPLGLLADRMGAKRTAILGMLLTLIPLLLGCWWADSFGKLLVVGLLLGVAGASFAVALPLASRWYPPQYQGLAMGIAGAGNSGTALATFFGPMLAQAFGWHAAFAIALAPMLATLAVFLVLAKDSPTHPAPRPVSDYLGVLMHRDTWWFCLFYSMTFGGFVGLASFLNSFFKLQYDLDPVQAGNYATLCVIAGSFLRPLGGYLSDRFGGIRMLMGLFVLVSALLLTQALLPPLMVATLVLFCIMALLGTGNGAVFQLVPLRFPKEIGVITGVVGAAGGIGGFFLPTILGGLKEATGSFGGGFLFFGLVSLLCAGAIVRVSRSWEGTFVGQGGKAALVGETASSAPAVEPAAAQV